METRRCGPSGGTGGVEFTDAVLPQDYRVLEVRFYARKRINGLQIIHEMVEGRRHSFPLHGRAVGDCAIFKLDADEFIVSVNGRFGTCVNAMCIHTNKRTSPWFGGAGGTGEYVYEALPGTEIVGFWGRASNGVDAIGVILRRRGL